MNTSPSTGPICAAVQMGPYFAVQLHDDAGGDWRPATEFAEPDGFACRQHGTAAALSQGPGVTEVAPLASSSITQMGLVARLTSPWFAVACDPGPLVVPHLADLWWTPQLGSLFPLAVAPAALDQRIESVDAWAQQLVSRLVEPLVAVAAGGPTTLWGNGVSAVNGAVKMITAARPDLAFRAIELGTAVIAAMPVQDAFAGSIGSPDFRRRSCCQIWRVAGSPAAVCGDCVLTASD